MKCDNCFKEIQGPVYKQINRKKKMKKKKSIFDLVVTSKIQVLAYAGKKIIKSDKNYCKKCFYEVMRKKMSEKKK